MKSQSKVCLYTGYKLVQLIKEYSKNQATSSKTAWNEFLWLYQAIYKVDLKRKLAFYRLVSGNNDVTRGKLLQERGDLGRAISLVEEMLKGGISKISMTKMQENSIF